MMEGDDFERIARSDSWMVEDVSTETSVSGYVELAGRKGGADSDDEAGGSRSTPLSKSRRRMLLLCVLLCVVSVAIAIAVAVAPRDVLVGFDSFSLVNFTAVEVAAGVVQASLVTQAGFSVVNHNHYDVKVTLLAQSQLILPDGPEAGLSLLRAEKQTVKAGDVLRLKRQLQLQPQAASALYENLCSGASALRSFPLKAVAIIQLELDGGKPSSFPRQQRAIAVSCPPLKAGGGEVGR